MDERTAASDAATFNENQVREAITIERTPKERDAFLKKLRDDAYIKVAESYRAAVAPLLNLPPEKTADNSVQSNGQKPEKKKGKLLGIFPRP